MLMGAAFPPSPDRLSPVGGQASSGYVPERLHPPPSRSTLSCGTTVRAAHERFQVGLAAEMWVGLEKIVSLVAVVARVGLVPVGAVVHGNAWHLHLHRADPQRRGRKLLKNPDLIFCWIPFQSPPCQPSGFCRSARSAALRSAPLSLAVSPLENRSVRAK